MSEKVKKGKGKGKRLTTTEREEERSFLRRCIEVSIYETFLSSTLLFCYSYIIITYIILVISLFACTMENQIRRLYGQGQKSPGFREVTATL